MKDDDKQLLIQVWGTVRMRSWLPMLSRKTESSGVDMTDKMLDKARDNGEKYNYKMLILDKATLKKEYQVRITVWILLQVIV
jgi:hypothetical protein